jgi:uncharacterized membrane protein YfcA
VRRSGFFIVDLPIPLALAALAACAVIGLVSGFLGIGGGVLFIPLFRFVGVRAGLDDVTALKQAMATSLLVASITALSGWLVHRRRGRAGDPSAVPLAAGVAAGAFLGATLSSEWLGASLKPLFGGALLLAAAVMFLRRERDGEGGMPTGARAALVGLPIGFVSAMVGLGGAVFTGFVFVGLLGRPVKRVAAATSLAQVFGGTLGWIGWARGGLGVTGLAPGSLGYVCLPAAAAVLVLSWPAARVGARFTHRTAPLWARAIYAAVLLALAVRFVTGG